MLVCDKCNAAITEGSKFCPQCGDPVTDADEAKSPAVEGGVAQVDISFGYSSSANFDTAVNICKNLPAYSVEGEDKKALHKITLPITEVELVIRVFELVGSWKSSRMLINGQPATKKDLTYYGVGCFRGRQKAYKPEQFCFGEKEYDANIWGCMRMNMPISLWGGGWLSYGSMNKQGVWTLDKDRIRHELEIAVKENELCPMLNKRMIFDTLDNLPETVNPKTDPAWEYSTSYEEVSGDYKEVATGIKPAPKRVLQYVISEYTPKWELEEPESNTNTIEVKLDWDELIDKPAHKISKPKASGCLLPLMIVAILVVTIFLTV